MYKDKIGNALIWWEKLDSKEKEVLITCLYHSDLTYDFPVIVDENDNFIFDEEV
jgi:hypothetical protein